MQIEITLANARHLIPAPPPSICFMSCAQRFGENWRDTGTNSGSKADLAFATSDFQATWAPEQGTM